MDEEIGTSGIVVEGGEVVRYCGQSDKAVVPAGIASIGERAFSGAPVTSVALPASVRVIAARAFEGSELLSIDLHGVEEVGMSAFRGCTSLRSVSFGLSTKTLGAAAFEACGLGVVSIPDGVEEIPYCCFMGCSDLRAVTIPPSVRVIDACAFADCPATIELLEGASPGVVRLNAFRGAKALVVGEDLPAKWETGGNKVPLICPLSYKDLQKQRRGRSHRCDYAAGRVISAMESGDDGRGFELGLRRYIRSQPMAVARVLGFDAQALRWLAQHYLLTASGAMRLLEYTSQRGMAEPAAALMERLGNAARSGARLEL